MQMKEMVDKFLAWPLPESVCADLCATKPGYPHRVGTNLLTATEAEQMLEHVAGPVLADLARFREALEKIGRGDYCTRVGCTCETGPADRQARAALKQ